MEIRRFKPGANADPVNNSHWLDGYAALAMPTKNRFFNALYLFEFFEKHARLVRAKNRSVKIADSFQGLDLPGDAEMQTVICLIGVNEIQR